MYIYFQPSRILNFPKSTLVLLLKVKRLLKILENKNKPNMNDPYLHIVDAKTTLRILVSCTN